MSGFVGVCRDVSGFVGICRGLSGYVGVCRGLKLLGKLTYKSSLLIYIIRHTLTYLDTSGFVGICRGLSGFVGICWGLSGFVESGGYMRPIISIVLIVLCCYRTDNRAFM